VAQDAKGEDELSLDFVKSRLLQEERRQADKSPAIKRIGDMAFVYDNYRGHSRSGDLSRIECYYCHKIGHISHDCAKLGQISHDCPVLQAKNKNTDKVAATAADDGTDSADAIYLVGNAADSDDITKS